MTLNDPTQISRARHYSTMNISEKIQDRHMVTTDHCDLSKCAVANDLYQPKSDFGYFFCLKIVNFLGL